MVPSSTKTPAICEEDYTSRTSVSWPQKEPRPFSCSSLSLPHYSTMNSAAHPRSTQIPFWSTPQLSPRVHRVLLSWRARRIRPRLPPTEQCLYSKPLDLQVTVRPPPQELPGFGGR